MAMRLLFSGHRLPSACTNVPLIRIVTTDMAETGWWGIREWNQTCSWELWHECSQCLHNCHHSRYKWHSEKKVDGRFSRFSLGKYLDKVDRVMTQVDRITEDIDHMPFAAFIFRNKESDEVQYSSDIRYITFKRSNVFIKKVKSKFQSP